MIKKQRRINSKEKKEIVGMLFSQFAYDSKLEEFTLFTNAKDKIHVVLADTVDAIEDQEFRIDSLGMYFGEKVNEKEFRLTIEGSNLIGKKCSKNIVEISDDELEKWMRGEDLTSDSEDNAFVIIKHKQDFLGCGKLKEKVIKNFIPKSRRIHSKLEQECSARV